MAEKKSQKKDPIKLIDREIRDGFDLSNEEIDAILDVAEAPETPVYRYAQERRDLAEEIATEMVRGWPYSTARAFRKAHGLTISQMKTLEKDANKILTNSYSEVKREDLVARQLSRLEMIAAKAADSNAFSTAQGCVSVILRTIGADKPEE